MKHPATAALAQQALTATGVKTHAEFCALTGNAIPLRTLRRWLAGEGPADALARLVLREIRDGWRPGGVDKRGRPLPLEVAS
ncbi:MAG: hypothetical protein ACJ8DZ_13960 [Allosphingosinicella sp.]